MNMGMAGDFCLAGINDDQLRSPVNGVIYATGYLGMGPGGIGTGDQDNLGLVKFVDGVGHGAGAEGGGKTCHRGRVSEPGAVVDVIGADNSAGKLLQQVVFLVAAFGRRQDTDGIGTMVLFDM